MTTTINQYLSQGCMRCKYCGTTQCKVHTWLEELELLREIALATGLTEEIKWGVPVYTHKGKNIITVNALKESANIGFFKGALLTDPQKILQQQGNLQSDRIIRFTKIEDIIQLKDSLNAYIHEAIKLEENGAKVIFEQNPEPLPAELLNAFEKDPSFEKAFKDLTPGRQRGYVIHFSQPKQSQTRITRIHKHKEAILKGIGLHDQDKS